MKFSSLLTPTTNWVMRYNYWCVCFLGVEKIMLEMFPKLILVKKNKKTINKKINVLGIYYTTILFILYFLLCTFRSIKWRLSACAKGKVNLNWMASLFFWVNRNNYSPSCFVCFSLKLIKAADLILCERLELSIIS